MYKTKHLFTDVSYSKGIRRQLWSTLSYYYTEMELYKEWKRIVVLEIQLLWCVLQQAIQVKHCLQSTHTQKNIVQTLIYRFWWKIMIVNKTKQKDKSKPIWSSCISCCRLLIFFSFIVVQNIFPSYWDSLYVCTLHKEMIKEIFLFAWSRKKAFLFFCAALLARSRNRQQNRCILCVASLKHTVAGQSRPICCTICNGKQNCWRHQARFLKKPQCCPDVSTVCCP